MGKAYSMFKRPWANLHLAPIGALVQSLYIHSPEYSGSVPETAAWQCDRRVAAVEERLGGDVD